MSRKFFLTLLVLLAVLLAACGPQSGVQDGGTPLQAWIDAPLNNSTLPVAAYTLIFSGASLGNAIDSFEVLVNGVAETIVPSVYENSQGDAHYSYGQHEWLPPAPGNYLIEVIAHSGDMASAPAQALVFVGDLAPESVEGQPPDDASEGEGAPPDDTKVIAIPNLDVNCRFGNSSQWDIADTLFEGQEYSPLGRGNDNLWVLFMGPATNVRCWVFVENLTMLLDDTETALADIPETLLPYVSYPPTPTPTPTPTPLPTATPTPAPECSDGIDNDGDGDIDMSDGRCTSPQDNSESS